MPALNGLLPTSFSDFGSFLSGPLLQSLFGLGSMREQDRLQNEYEADWDQQRADMLRIAGQIGPQTLQTYESASQPALMELLGLRPRQRRGANEIVQGFQDRYNQARDDLKGYGQQQARDIDRSFDEDWASNLARMQERGIASSTAVGSQKNLNTERRSAEQRRLGEDLQRLRLSILPQLSADTLGARGSALDLDRLLTGDISNWYGQNATTRANIVGRGMDTMLNTTGSFQFMPPGPNPYPGQIGQNMVDPVDYSKGQSSSAPWIQAGGTAAGVIAATIFIGICIGEDSLIECPVGVKPLRDVQVGDVVTNADGQPRKVVAKHLSEHRGDWDKNFVTLTFDGNSIVCSLQHKIEGRQAMAWMTTPGANWSAAGPRQRVGDILLEDQSDYIANGLRIESIIGPEDVVALLAMEPENNGVEVEAI